jgi:hypothetical protein
MLYGQVMMKNYVEQPALSFAAIGGTVILFEFYQPLCFFVVTFADVPCQDKSPLQICDFAEGNDLDTWIKRLWLEEGKDLSFLWFELLLWPAD